MTIRRRNVIIRQLGWIVCLVAGHVPSRRRARVSDEGVYSTVCRRCEVRLARRDNKWKAEPAHKA